MNLFDVVSHTPLWVWVLLVFIVSRGLSALRPREIGAQRALIVPLAFLVWGLSGLIGQRGFGLDLVLFVVGGAAGAFGGGALAQTTPAPGLDRARGVLAMPGSWIPLALIVAAFAIKYSLAVAQALADDPSRAATLASCGAFVGGVFAGLFWGRTLTQFRRALKVSGQPSDWGAVAALVMHDGRTRS